jgi:hypothetical protein
MGHLKVKKMYRQHLCKHNKKSCSPNDIWEALRIKIS